YCPSPWPVLLTLRKRKNPRKRCRPCCIAGSNNRPPWNHSIFWSILIFGPELQVFPDFPPLFSNTIHAAAAWGAVKNIRPVRWEYFPGCRKFLPVYLPYHSRVLHHHNRWASCPLSRRNLCV